MHAGRPVCASPSVRARTILCRTSCRARSRSPSWDLDCESVGNQAGHQLAAAAHEQRLLSTISCRTMGHVRDCTTTSSPTRWRSRLHSAGPAAPLPTNLTRARILPPATQGWQAPGNPAVPSSLRDYGEGGGANNGGGVGDGGAICAAAPPPANPTANWPTPRQGDRLGIHGHPAGCLLYTPRSPDRPSKLLISVAGPPAPCRTCGAAASKLSGARRLQHWGGGPQAIYLFPRRCRLRRQGWRWQRRRRRRQQRTCHTCLYNWPYARLHACPNACLSTCLCICLYKYLYASLYAHIGTQF